jgi:DNA primase
LAALWKAVHEPVLCFDGDEAGIGAAERAARVAFPALVPGVSLSVTYLPKGEDPDTFVRRYGAEAMHRQLGNTIALAEAVWRFELAAGPVDTPDARAALEARLEERVKTIVHDGVRAHYRQFFREKAREAFFRRRQVRSADPAPLSADPATAPALAAISARRRQEAMLGLLIRHPAIVPEVEGDLAALDLPDELARVAAAILSAPGDERFAAEAFERLSARPIIFPGCADTDADALELWRSMMGLERYRPSLDAEIAEARERYRVSPNDENWSRLVALQDQRRTG